MRLKIKSDKKYIVGSVNTFRIADMRSKKTREIRAEVISCVESTSAFIKDRPVYELTISEVL